MNNDFLQNEEESLISSFDGSFRKALDKKNNPVTTENQDKKKPKKSSKEIKKQKESKTNEIQTTLSTKNIQIRVSPDSLLKLKKIQMTVLEEGITKSIKQIVDDIISDHCSSNYKK